MRPIYTAAAMLLIAVTAHAENNQEIRAALADQAAISRADETIWTKEKIQAYLYEAGTPLNEVAPAPAAPSVQANSVPPVKPTGAGHYEIKITIPPGYQQAHRALPGNAQLELETVSHARAVKVSSCLGNDQDGFMVVDENYQALEPFKYYSADECLNRPEGVLKS